MTGLKRTPLSAMALGVALGLMCGSWMLVVSLLAWHEQFTPVTTDMVSRWAAIFPGIGLSMAGSFVAGSWGFLKGFFSGLVFGWIYNLCLCGCSRCCPCCRCATCGSKSAACSATTEVK